MSPTKPSATPRSGHFGHRTARPPCFQANSCSRTSISQSRSRPRRQDRRSEIARRDRSGRVIDEEVNRLSTRAEEALTDIYKKLTPWQKTQVARHPNRPHFSDYVSALVTEWTPLAGDRKFGEDAAIQAGFGRIDGQPVAIIGQEKGSTTETRLKHNFGMAKPEGYRKAVRVMDMADRFNMPLVSFVDTAGAYPGIGAEERGQAEAIARSTEKSLELGVPNLAIVIGEGGSGGAIAIATANRVLMLEHAIYSVTSPEGGGLDPLARRRQGPGRGQQHEDHRQRTCSVSG